MNAKAQTTPPTAEIVVIGVGNDFRMDDAAGLEVVRKLKAEVSKHAYETGVNVLECSGGSFELMELWAAASHVVLVDAVASGADPGTIFRLDLHDHSIPSFLFHYSTHGFNLSDTVELARLLGKLPPKLVVFGIEGMDFSQGQGLTEDVAVAIERVVRSLLDYIGNNLEAAGQPGEVLSHA